MHSSKTMKPDVHFGAIKDETKHCSQFEDLVSIEEFASQLEESIVARVGSRDDFQEMNSHFHKDMILSGEMNKNSRKKLRTFMKSNTIMPTG